MGHTFMLISIVLELDIPLASINLSVEVVAAFTSKIHAVVDALGNLIAFTATAGQYSKYPQA